MDETSDDILPYCSIKFMFDHDSAALTVVCFDVRVHAELWKPDLLSDSTQASTLSSRFQWFVEAMDDHVDAMESFEDWLFLPCVRHLEHLAGIDHRRSTLSVHDCYHAPTFEFDLKNVDGQLEAFRRPADTMAFRRYIPRVSVADPMIASALDQGVLCIYASQLLLVRDQSLSDWEYFVPPSVVERMNLKGPRFFFKAAQEWDLLTRELDMLLRVREMCSDAHVTQLVGLVRWNDDPSIAGLLLEYIPNAKTLDWAVGEGCAEADRSRWISELRRVVGRLHEAGIVWGDVKPQNVLVDANGQAWVVDFGGGHSLPWVHKEVSGTKEGDLAGLEAIANYLG